MLGVYWLVVCGDKDTRRVFGERKSEREKEARRDSQCVLCVRVRKRKRERESKVGCCIRDRLQHPGAREGSSHLKPMHGSSAAVAVASPHLPESDQGQ